jgi:hypothetical protein
MAVTIEFPGLKPGFMASLNVRAKAQTYLKSKDNRKNDSSDTT